MRVTQITASVAAFPDPEKRNNGKEVFFAANAVPDNGGSWTLEEACVNFLNLTKDLSLMTNLAMYARGMLGKDKIKVLNDTIAKNFTHLIGSLSDKITKVDSNDPST
jgi:hypothetical protein